MALAATLRYWPSKFIASWLFREPNIALVVVLLTLGVAAAGFYGSQLPGGAFLSPNAVSAQEDDHYGGGDYDDGGGDHDDGGGTYDDGGGDHDDGGGTYDDGGGDHDVGGVDHDDGGGDHDVGGIDHDDGGGDHPYDAAGEGREYVVDDCVECGWYIDPGCPKCGGYIDGDPTFVPGSKFFDSYVGLWYVIPEAGTDFDPSASISNHPSDGGGKAGDSGSIRERYDPPDFSAEPFENLGELRDAPRDLDAPSPPEGTGSSGGTDAPPGTDSPGDTGASGGPEAPGDTATPQAEITTVNRGPSEAGKFIVEQRVRQKAENEFERRREEFNAGRREVSLCPLWAFGTVPRVLKAKDDCS